jgi:uncharacterized protein (TIGR01777 family)
MRVVVTGASGLVGSLVLERLRGRGDQVIGVARRPEAAAAGVEWVVGDVTERGAWQDAVAGADAVVHLAGEPLDARRWSPEQKGRLTRSRVEGTRRVVEAQARRAAPAVLVSASAVGYFGPRGEEPLDEDSAPGTDFLAGLCQDWEEAARASAPHVRVVCLRFAVVLSRRGGALARMLPAFKMFVGGPLGDARAWFPWIHEEDAAGLVLHALDQGTLRGPVNAVAPELVRMGDFVQALGRRLGRPSALPVPLAALRVVLGELAGSINPGQKVVPRAAVAAGYHFRHERLDSALAAALP